LVVLVILGVFLGTALFGAPYVPSREAEVEEAFRRLRPLKAKDCVVDFGCGDGAVLRAAIKAGAGKVVGLELNPLLVLVARWRCRKEKRILVKCCNMNRCKLPEEMTVAYVFGLDRVMKMIRPRLERFAKSQGRTVYVVSNAFEFEGMKPVKKWGSFYLFEILPEED
jgi:SAM-dependent methyltransferase